MFPNPNVQHEIPRTILDMFEILEIKMLKELLDIELRSYRITDW